MLKRLLTAVTVLALALVAAPSAAHAEPREPTCRGYSCDGLNPMSVDCYRDAVTLQGTRGYYWAYTFVIRYSPTCQAAWARVEGSVLNGAGLYIRSYYADWSYRTSYYSLTNADVPYTPMVYAGFISPNWGLFTEACIASSCGAAFYSIA